MNNKKTRSICIILLVIYLLLLFRITVFRSHAYQVDFSVNFSLFTDLFATYHENGLWMVLYLVIGNIVWFVPFGFLVPEIWKNLKFGIVVPLGFLLSLTIETGQLLLHKGMFEIDDLVLNTFGTAIGYFVYKIHRSFRK